MQRLQVHIANSDKKAGHQGRHAPWTQSLAEGKTWAFYPFHAPHQAPSALPPYPEKIQALTLDAIMNIAFRRDM